MFDKNECACFSGYRPEKLPDGGDDSKNSIKSLRVEIRSAVLEAIEHGFNTFFTGMAEGFDLIAAEEVLMLRGEGQEISLIAVNPYDDGRKHSGRFNSIIEQADDSVTLSDKYSRGAYYIRNESPARSIKLCSAVSIPIQPPPKFITAIFHRTKRAFSKTPTALPPQMTAHIIL